MQRGQRASRKAACESLPENPEFSYFAQAFDQHLNMVLGDVEETLTIHEVDLETEEEIIKVNSSQN